MTNPKTDQKCKNRFRIKQYIALDGRRFSLLFDSEEGAMPALWPTAFCSHCLRGKSANTEHGYLQTIRKAMAWASEQGVDIEELLQSAKGFTSQQVDSIAQALGERKQKRELKGNTINPRSFNKSLDELGSYLSWLFRRLRNNPNSPADKEFLSQLKDALNERKRKEGSRAAYAQNLLGKKISEVTREALTGRFDNPCGFWTTSFQQGVSFRDTLMIRIFYDLGIRLGELLSLTLSNFKPATGGDYAYLEIVRNHDDEFDRRVNQPVAKTNGRLLAISSDLERSIITYLGDWRAQIPGVGFDDTSFLFVVHKGGPNQGRELAISTVRSYFTELRRSNKRLCTLHPHQLRHDWNYRFSIECKKRGISEKREIEERCFLMGWREGSDMAKHYNRRHIAEESYKIGVAIASSTNQRDK